MLNFFSVSMLQNLLQEAGSGARRRSLVHAMLALLSLQQEESNQSDCTASDPKKGGSALIRLVLLGEVLGSLEETKESQDQPDDNHDHSNHKCDTRDRNVQITHSNF